MSKKKTVTTKKVAKAKAKRVKQVVTTVTTTTTTTTTPREIYDFFVLDRSGSMSAIQDATISGFNEYINASKRAADVPGVEAFVSVLLFDDEFLMLNDFSNINDVKPMTRETFVPRGSTALNDATAKAIQMLLNRLAGREASPDVDVTITVMTDGQENASTEFPNTRSTLWSTPTVANAALNSLINRVKGYGWTVNYVGAGSQREVQYYANSLGVDLSNVKHYTANVSETVRLFDHMSSARGMKSATFASTGAKCNTGYFTNVPTPDTQVTNVKTTVETTEDTISPVTPTTT